MNLEKNMRNIFGHAFLAAAVKHPGDKSLDLPSFPTKNRIFQHSIFNISGCV